ncbi:MAG: efflux RND transporter periplasmic adaptor subunit [Clostridiales bacterium]|nr:efflux RND transporter periplasmic adaptor subunit [Clostridiales bacterium]
MSEKDEQVVSQTPKKKTHTGKKKRGRFGRAVRKTVKIIVVVALLCGAGLFGLKAYINKQAESSSATSYSRAVVTRGALEETVYGSGTTSARNQTNVLAEAEGTLTDLRVSVGDAVKAGDILAVMTNADLDDTITDLEFDLWELDDQILSTSAGSKVTTIEAPAAGRVVAIYAEAGDDALAVFRREGALAIISTDGRMKVELSDVDTSSGVSLGEKLTVTGETFIAEGTVVDLTRQGTSLTLTIQDDSLPMGETVTVARQNGVSLGTSTLEVNKPMAVSSYGGTIESVKVSVGDKVKRADTLFKLTDSPLTLKIENLRLQREAAAKSLEEAKQQRENLIVVAPCDGMIATLSISEGDEISSGAMLCSILEGEDMNLTIAVDELDVVEVEVGQKVKITVDALSDAEMDGEVYKIAPVGSNSGGVTTYDVELTFDAEGSGVRSGMNATGEITVASTDSTLYVPVEALMTIGNDTYLMVENEGETASTMAADSMSELSNMPQGGSKPDFAGSFGERSGDASSGETSDAQNRGNRGNAPQRTQNAEAATEESGLIAAVKKLYSGVMDWLYADVNEETQVSGSLVKVTTGMQNDDYVEILSGVSEGDVVLYTGSSSSSSSNMMMSMMTMGTGNRDGGGNRGGNMGGGPGGF